LVRRRLDSELVRRGLAPSRNQAATAIKDGRVLVAGAPATSPARMVGPDESVAVVGDAPRFVSRGGEKLDAALTRFAVPVAGRAAIDVGSSTGGFSDCLLQRGAASVVAVDVGRAQLAWALREDPRVVVRERTNVRTADAHELGAPFDLVVVDLSFISLRTVAPALAALAGETADTVALVKPQFEVGRARLGKGGIVRDEAARSDAVRHVVDAMRDAGLMTIGAMPSPLRGADGNLEFLIHARRDQAGVATDAVEAALAEVSG
jgi:23S rRNA (cytidine1920-2'-O)/16S rRNA (cytidine1409-2'-O)-methyltransferase